jgi:hypothetical protein
VRGADAGDADRIPDRLEEPIAFAEGLQVHEAEDADPVNAG